MTSKTISGNNVELTQMMLAESAADSTKAETVKSTGGALNVNPISSAINAAATATAIASGTVNVQGVAATANLRLMGYTITETAATAAAATVTLRNGTLATDPAITSPIKLVANEAKTIWFGPDGIASPNGIFVNRTAGETTLVLYTKVQA